jgi:hypothetical protein
MKTVVFISINTIRKNLAVAIGKNIIVFTSEIIIFLISKSA